MMDFAMWIILFVITMLLFFTGCSSVLFDTTSDRTYAITKAPYQIVVSGDLSKEDSQDVRTLIRDLSKYEYKEYKFNEKIDVHVTGAESDVRKINLHNLSVNNESINDEEDSENEKD